VSSGTTTIVKPQADESDLSDAREAFVMMIKECAETCTTQEELQELWVGNKGELDKTKKVSPTVHEDLKQFFQGQKRGHLKRRVVNGSTKQTKLWRVLQSESEKK
jgi:hypothetical protein